MLTMFQIRKDRKLNARTNAQELTLDRNYYAGSSSSQMVGTAQEQRLYTDLQLVLLKYLKIYMALGASFT